MAKSAALRASSRAAPRPPVVAFTLPLDQLDSLDEARARLQSARDALAGALDLALAARPGEAIACQKIAALLQGPVMEVEAAHDCLECVHGGEHARTH